MKKQILMLIIGILIGAIITTGVFLILKENTTENSSERMDMKERPTMDGNMTDGENDEFKTERNQKRQENTTTDTTDNTSGI